ncbi:MAG: tetratricopeptide repeat protein, partial [Acidobacteriota bacterium]
MESPRTRSPYPGTSSALSTIAGLGRCKLETIRLDQARALFERAVEIQEDALGPDHPNLIFPLTQLAEIDRRQRNLDQAAERYERALVIGERTLGPEHPDLLWALGSYALLLANRGDVEGARENLDRALQIAKEAHGSKHL